MREEPLPERLRELADDLAAHGADDPQPRAETCAALTGAADELERLAAAEPVIGAAPGDVDVLLRDLVDLAERLSPPPSDDGRDWRRVVLDARRAVIRMRAAQHVGERLEARIRGAVGVRPDDAAGLLHVIAMDFLGEPVGEALDRMARRCPGRDGRTLADELGRELAGDAGVPSPMPQPRRFAAYYAAAWPLPAPGSFVQTPPAGAVWRVLSVDEGPGAVYVDRDGGERRPSVLVLEAVDPHDVPAGARADMVPLPVQELGPDGGES